MGNQLRELAAAGQSIWLDNIRRSMFASGELQTPDRQGLRGMTSQSDDLREGDRRRQRLRRAAAAAWSAASTTPLKLFEALAIRDIRSACDVFAPVYREHAAARRLRLARSLAAAGARHARHDRRGRAAVESRRPAQRDDQDSRHARGHAGDSRVDRRRHQHQRHAALLGRPIRGRGERLHRRARGPRRRRASRSTRSPRSPASSSPASTPRSTRLIDERIAKGEKLEELLGQGRRSRT